MHYNTDTATTYLADPAARQVLWPVLKNGKPFAWFATREDTLHFVSKVNADSKWWQGG